MRSQAMAKVSGRSDMTSLSPTGRSSPPEGGWTVSRPWTMNCPFRLLAVTGTWFCACAASSPAVRAIHIETDRWNHRFGLRPASGLGGREVTGGQSFFADGFASTLAAGLGVSALASVFGAGDAAASESFFAPAL